MKNVCNFNNVMGNLLGMRESEGLPVTMDHLNQLDASGKARYNDTVTQHGADVFDEAPVHKSDNEALASASQWLSGDAKNVAKHVLQDYRNPSGLFGEERVKSVIDFITEHYAEYGNSPEGRKAYMDDIGLVFDDIDTSDLSPSLQDAWNKYQRFYESGGELYSLNQRSGIEKGLNNLTGNVIKSSPTVIMGNVLEGITKLPTLYPKTFLPAMAEASKQGLFKKIPELEKKGVYGLNYGGEQSEGWSGLIGLTDIPLKNIAYYAGKLAGQDGAKAVQNVAFTPRFGDLPGVYYSSGGRLATQLLGYTINTYKMYASLLAEAKRGNPAPLITYHALSGLVGGGLAAGLPSVAESVITGIAPETQEWFDENKGPLAKLVQPGNISRLGVSLDIANRQGKAIVKNLQNGRNKLADGDSGGVLDLADAGLAAMSFSSSPVGDLNIQKALRIAKEVAQGELDFEDVPDEAVDKYLPYLQDAQ